MPVVYAITSATPMVRLSTQERPTRGLQEGQVLYLFDTREEFWWDGDSWIAVPDAIEDRTVATLDAMLSELRKIRFGLETHLGTDLPDPGE